MILHRALAFASLALGVGLLLASCCQHGTVIGCPAVPSPAAPALLHRLFGDTASQARAHEIDHPFGPGIKVFTVTHFTWPHIPQTSVALVGDAKRGEILPLSGLPVGFGGSHPLENFNDLARRNPRAIPEKEVESYLRFFLTNYIAPLESDDFFATRAQVGAAVGRSRESVRGNWNVTLPVEKRGDHATLRCWYRSIFEIRELSLRLDRRDGSIALEDTLFARI